MLINLFSSRGWESWGLEHRPLIPERMPVLIDDDLRFEDGPGAPRPALAVNRWLQELPVSGAPAVSTWHTYGRIVKDWMEFLEVRGVSVFAGREALRAALSAYAEYRATGPLRRRFSAATWNQHVSVLASLYRWALAEGHAQAEPFSYRIARGMFAGRGGEIWVNRSARRRPKPHVTIKYLEPDFTAMFLNALAGLCPDGSADGLFHGRELARNHAIGQLAVATGLRLQEFTYLLSYEIPPLPRTRTDAPIAFGVPSGVTKGRKFRTTWISYDALAGVDQYLQLDREAATAGRPGRRVVPCGGAGRRRAVHRLGQCFRADLRPDPGPFRASFPARHPPPGASHLRHADFGVPGQRLLPAGRGTGRSHLGRHWAGRGAGVVSGQGRPAAC